MSIIPILIDTRLPHAGSADDCSLLLLPSADDLLLHELLRSAARVTGHHAIVLTAFAPDAAYIARIRNAASNIEDVVQASRFDTVLDRFRPSDSLLFMSPMCYPVDGIELRPLLSTNANDARMVRHLIAFEAPTSRTKELVQADEFGRIRKIQRYFEPVTWPFPSGVLASLVPVACAQMVSSLELGSLEELRAQLSSSGIPNQDVPFHGDCFDLTDESGVLSLGERRVNEVSLLIDQGKASRIAKQTPLQSPDANVHVTARLVGPVLVLEGAEIGAGALVIGPAIVGQRATIGRDAVVAQCMVLPGAIVPDAVTVRHRVVSGEFVAARPAQVQRRHAAPHLIEHAEPSRRALPTYVTAKALVEPVLAAIALVLLAPLMLLLAVLVKLTSPGPVFYGDSREGKDARAFKCWKFRTMFTNASEMQRALKAAQDMDGPQFKMVNDPRVTKAGRWLRRLNVDELPQLWNVIRGEMSFVGPRPSPFSENQICVPWRNGRLSVRPGITGLWQVCRKDRKSGDFHQWIHYDLLYVRNVSVRLDFMILAATIFTLGGRRPVPLSLMLGRKPNPRTRAVATSDDARFRSQALHGTGAR
jgi:lipopolysaccharide/colanic/teichoic acid biosynthesis glycosyltransferase